MKTHFLSLLLLAIILVSSCSQEEIVQQQTVSLSDCKFIASFEQTESRTYLEDGKYLRWTANDELSVFMGKTLNRQFRFTGKTGDNSGGFEEASSPGFVTGNDLDNPCHYAIYPYAKGTKITETGVLTVNLPSEQTYEENSFGCGANTMVAVTSSLSDMELSFKNACGYLKFKLYGDDVTVKSVTLQSNGEEKLSGSATLIAANDKNPSIAMSSTASNMITLDCGTGVKIGSTAETATEFWFVVPPTTFENGFTVTIKDVNGNEFIKSTSKKISLERNVIKPISAFKVEVQTDDIPYLTFTAGEEQNLTMSKAVETLEYSVNGGEWKELGTSKVTFGGENGNLRLRGKNNFGTARGWLDYSKIQFGRSNSVSCSGDIRTLLDYENYLIVDTKNARFCYLFEWCYELISAPKLPLEILASECYREMFSGCTNLTEAPELPATTLNSGCYYGMFQDCSNLTKAPELPATTLRSSCYSRMFQGCSNLTKAPELSATLLGSGCYNCMFRYCTNLIEAPELPATTLTEGCYEGMFIDCTSLAEAPVLPATTLTERCYSAMFAGCSKLTVAPKLPATNLATECYFMMFQETGLVKAPELPATYLTTGCYNNMFAASNLAIAPELPATNLANECYLGMFGGCANLTIAPKLPATNLASQCYYKMFSNCTSLTEASVLPATRLAYQCYYRMFDSCIQLNTITMLATNITASECLYNWVEGVASTGTFTKAKEMEDLPNGYNGIPNGWTVKNYGEE